MSSGVENNNTTKRGRNWTKEETELFVKVITDTNDEYALILERKALKKASKKSVFEEFTSLHPPNLILCPVHIFAFYFSNLA